MEIRTFKRYENKYLLTTEQYCALLERLLQFVEPDEHCRDGSCYKICNIYFDTTGNNVIRHSVNKPYYKEKMRLRSYGTPATEDSEVFLEIKKKIGGIVNKRRVTMSLAEVKRYLKHGERPETDDYLTKQVLNEIDYYISDNPVSPAAYISYDRIALFGKEDRSLRITFDNNIITRRTDLALEKGVFGEQLLVPGEYLMEIKISGSVPLKIARILSELGIYSKGYSKYGSEYKRMLSRALGITAECGEETAAEAAV